jgi:putative ABC transport system substrate-binding protein
MGAVLLATRLAAEAQQLLFDRPSPLLVSADEICQLALQRKLPTAAATRAFVNAGCLMSYGENRGEMFHRAAVFVDKILKGVKLAELPIEQPTKFELVSNLKTAKALGLTMPPALLGWELLNRQPRN